MKAVQYLVTMSPKVGRRESYYQLIMVLHAVSAAQALREFEYRLPENFHRSPYTKPKARPLENRRLYEV